MEPATPVSLSSAPREQIGPAFARHRPLSGADLRRVVVRLEEASTAEGIEGGILGIAQGGEIFCQHAFGRVRTVEGVHPMRIANRFPLTSVTKVFTALQVVKLAEQGLLALNRPLVELVPEFVGGGKELVTPLHVLTHTAGARTAEATTSEGRDVSLDSHFHISNALNAKLTWKPGTHVEYHSALFWLLATIVGRISGMPYERHLSKYVLEPYGMGASGYSQDSDIPPDLALAFWPDGQVRSDGARRLAYPAGGMISSVSDLLSFGLGLLGTTGAPPLGNAGLFAMSKSWTNGLPGWRESGHPGPGTERGIGWALGGPGVLRPDAMLWHSGASGPSIWVSHELDLVVVLMLAQWDVPRHFYGNLIDHVVSTVMAI